jgi:hypothetical protein
MNCQNHPDRPATAYCRSCGKPVCNECRRDAYGTVYCAEHVPAAPAEPASAPPPPPPPPGAPPFAPYPPVARPDISPGLAFFLGWIPGVGAIYNGQYAKGLVHAVIWGLLVNIISTNAGRGLEPLFGILIAAWEFYMAFEAYHTAQRRRMGEPVDEYSSLLNLGSRGVAVGPIALIVVGGLLLMHTLNVLDFERIARFWPVLLIGLGAWLLYLRLSAPGANAGRDPFWGRSHERR